MSLDPITLALWIVALAWWTSSFVAIRDVRAVPPLPKSRPAANGLPKVSAIVTARNEEERVEQTVCGLIGQTGVDLRVILVDDRSSDGTTEIAKRLARDHTEVEAIHIEQLAADWLGKPHACDAGARRASGDWILFTDGDIRLEPDVVARAVQAAQAEGADHVCLFPGEARTTLPARAALLHFSTGLLFFAARANRDKALSFIGVGAFNLVSAASYETIGGHRPLRLEVIDDLKLGLLLRRAGFRSRAYAAPHDAEVRWAGTVGEVIRALEKNLFALFDFSILLAVPAVALLLLLLGGALIGPFTGRIGGIVAFCGMLSAMVPAWMLSRRTGWGITPAILSPLMMSAMAVAVARSAFVTLRDGGIRWRGTAYPLEVLRRGRVRIWPRGD